MDLKLQNKVAVVTGGGGVICRQIAMALAGEGVDVAIWDFSLEAANSCCDELKELGVKAAAFQCDATDKASVEAALRETVNIFGRIDILVNGAGGSRKQTTTSDDLTFFDMSPEDIKSVMDLNYMTAVIPSQAVGKIFAGQKSGVIINISSIAGLSPLTNAIAYSNGKAATNSLTQWLAVHMAKNYSPEIRVNAIAPGFILSQQNRFLLVDEKTGEMTPRGKTIIENVPAGRYGRAEEISGAVLWLASESASFVTGAVVPVDGGYTAYSGV